MLSRHIKFSWDEEPDFLFYGDTGNGEHLLYPSRTIRIFLTGENVPPNWSEADYALTHERIWNERHWRVPLWRHWYDDGNTPVMRDFQIVRARVDRFCNFIYSNDRAKQRIEFFHLLSQYKQVDAGGKVLNNIGGRVDDKRDYLARCKFTIAFENESHPGYATEKIIEPLLMGSIPIYWGDPHIDEDFNPDCFINVHRFDTFADVVAEVRRIDEDDELWGRYVTAPIFRNNQLPDLLSDAAVSKFCGRIFADKISRISFSRKLVQRSLEKTKRNSVTQRLKAHSRTLLRIVRGVKRRISVVARSAE